MLGSWAGRISMQADLIGKEPVDLPLKARRRATTLSERMGWMHGLVDPVSLLWEVRGAPHWSTK
jgi:hypothetical protein